MEDFAFEEKKTSLLQDSLERVQKEIGKVIKGQQQMIRLLLIGLLSDGHLLIEGVPGVAKTLTARLIAGLTDTGFSRIQFTPDLMPGDVLGTSIFNPDSGTFEFKRGPIFSNIILIDEINRAPAKTQSALFEVMEERQVTIDGHTHPMEFPFMVLATQNPIEQEGTYRLPEAQLDRFLLRIEVGYPELEEEIDMLNSQQNISTADLMQQVERLITPTDIKEYRKIVNEVTIHPDLIAFIARLVQATRNDTAIYLGGSPRASLALLRTSKAFAALAGRDFVTPDDVVQMAPPVLAHRILLSPEMEMEGAPATDIIREIVSKVEVPH